MSVTAEYLDWLADVLAPLGAVAARRMFGGAGLYLGDAFFAVVLDDTLHLKADAPNRAIFEAAGAAQLYYKRGRKDVLLPFWAVPEEVAADEDELRRWARLAVEASERGRVAGGRPRQRRPGTQDKPKRRQAP